MATVGWNPYEGPVVQRIERAGEPRLAVGIAGSSKRIMRHRFDRIAGLIDRANAEAAGRFRVLSTEVAGAPDIDWHTDPRSGTAWPRRFHTRFTYAAILDRGQPSDVKVPWEMSRLQFLPRLALAYRLTDEDRYLSAMRRIVGDWDRANPVGYGINWTVAMEASLRAISLLLAEDLLSGTDVDGPVSAERRSALLAEHGRFVYRNVEYSDINGNHYTSCLLGLLYLGVSLPGEPEASDWVDFAVSRLHAEIGVQTYADGVCHEGSIPYHGFVAELFLHALLVAERCGIEFSADYRDRLGRMLTFTRAYLKPGGGVPIWGDNDDGRVVDVGGDLDEHHRSLLALGAILLGRHDLWYPGDTVPLAAALLTSSDDRDRLARESARTLPGDDRRPDSGGSSASVGFREGGFFILRRRDDYCLIDCGDVGMRGRGGHGHNDSLSVELALAGYDILTDTGCDSYTRSQAGRLACIGAAAHNAVVVAGEEPAELSLARVPHAGPVPVEFVGFDRAAARFVGRHYGYRDLGVERYERRIELPGNARSQLLLEDELSGTGRFAASWRFHLAPTWGNGVVHASGACFEARRNPTPLFLKAEWRLDGAEARITTSPVFPTYGDVTSRPCLELKAELTLPAILWIRFRLESHSSR